MEAMGTTRLHSSRQREGSWCRWRRGRVANNLRGRTKLTKLSSRGVRNAKVVRRMMEGWKRMLRFQKLKQGLRYSLTKVHRRRWERVCQQSPVRRMVMPPWRWGQRKGQRLHPRLLHRWVSTPGRMRALTLHKECPSEGKRKRCQFPRLNHHQFPRRLLRQGSWDRLSRAVVLS